MGFGHEKSSFYEENSEKSKKLVAFANLNPIYSRT